VFKSKVERWRVGQKAGQKVALPPPRPCAAPRAPARDARRVQALMLSWRAQTMLLLTAAAGGGGTDEARTSRMTYASEDDLLRTSRIRRLSLEMNLAVAGEARPALPAACLLLSEEAMRQAIPPPPPPSRTKWTLLVHPSVLTPMRQAIPKAVEFTQRLTHRASPPRAAAAAAAAAAGAGGGSLGSPGSEEAADASEDDVGLQDCGEEMVKLQ